MESQQAPIVLFEHDPSEKPVSAFSDHAPVPIFPKFVLHRRTHLYELRKVMGYSQTC
jgi:hypothetical protein